MPTEAGGIGTLFRSAQNCWRAGGVSGAAFRVDGERYFATLAETLPLARRRIWIVGWDFDPEIPLRPDDPESPCLGDMLRQLVETHPELEVRILVWGLGPIFSNQSVKLFVNQKWSSHERIQLRLDSRHPIRGSHHQKIVSIDDGTAFVGGMDLTAGRWDDRQHLASSPMRVKPNGEAYGPVHDVQLGFTGPLAHHVAELCIDRWRRATGEALEPLAEPLYPWPSTTRFDLRDCEGALARTRPGGLFRKGRAETKRLTEDMIRNAHRFIYLETQYLASFQLGTVLGRRLREADGPEVVVVVTESSRGMIEQFVMAHNRDRLIRRLKRADRHGRLRLYYAVTPLEDGGAQEILVHSKVIVVDDEVVRVGSSNLNNRSEGLDTECDVALAAASLAHRQAIAGFRDGLLAEHMGRRREEVAALVQETGSLIAAIEILNTGRRRLEGYDVDPDDGLTTPLPGTGILDPRKPFWPLQQIGRGLRRFGSNLLRRFRGRRRTQNDLACDQ